jgi:F-type H+-transporting ATPase subunit a
VTVANIAPGESPDVHDIETGVVLEPPAPDADEPDEHADLRGKDAGVLIPFLRGANTDLNTTLAIALFAMLSIQYWGFRTLGMRGYGGKFVNIRQGPVFFAVGLLEIISEISRVISFTFRLFGNMFAGEILLVAMAFLFPLIGIIPFLGLELFVGFIQAFIFAMLTLVFAVVATAAHGEEGH